MRTIEEAPRVRVRTADGMTSGIGTVFRSVRGMPVTVWLLLAAPAAAGSQDVGSVLSVDDRIRRTDAIFAEWDRPDSPGCAVGIVREGELVFTRGYGSANLDYGVPLTASSVFHIASDSKQFTAAAIARLVLDGRVSLEDEIQTYVPEIPRYEWPVRIRHLVHHTSGLRDYINLMDLGGRSFDDFWDNAGGIELMSRQKALNFEPGSEHVYINSDYSLLGEIVHQVTGRTLDEYTREFFFEPLGMSATGWAGGEDYATVLPNRVVSYGRSEDGAYLARLKHFHDNAGGNLLTTVEDLARWDRIFYEEEGPWKELVDLMLTRGVLNDGLELAYAFGLRYGAYRGLETVSHGGGMLGFRSQFLRFPGQRFSAICLCNAEHMRPALLSQQLADIWLFESEPPSAGPLREEATESEDEPEPWVSDDPGRYAGHYFSEELEVTYVIETLSDGGLQVTLPGYARALHGIEPHVFGDRWGLMRLVFDVGGGPATGFSFSLPRVRGIRFVRR